MADSPFRERRLSPKEVKEIVKRAAELSTVDSPSAADGATLTIGELQHRLRDLGISEDATRRALSPVVAGSPELAPGPDGTIRVEREVRLDGMLDPANFEKLAELISKRMHLPGRPSALGNKLTWAPTGVLVEPSVSIHAKDGTTTIRYVETIANRWQMMVGFGTLAGMSGLIAGTFTSLGGVAIAKGADISRATGAPVVLGAGVLLGICAAVASFLGLKRTVEKRVAKRAAFADELVTELARVVQSSLEDKPARARVEPVHADTVEEHRELEAAAEEEQAIAQKKPR